MLEQFLNDIVSEQVGHELQRVWLNLVEDLILLGAIGGLEFLLNEARAVLVTRKFNDMVINILFFISSNDHDTGEVNPP